MAEQPPAPVICRQDRERLIHEDAAPLGGGELAAVIIQIVEGFDVIDQLPRLAAPQDRGGEGQGVEGHVVLAHELNIADILGPLVGAPPAFPIRPLARIDPFGSAGDIFDGRVEPDIEHLALHPRPRLIALFDGNAPIQIAGDAAILQPVTVIEPFLGDRGGQDRPIGLRVDPCAEFITHRRLAQIQMLGLAHLELGGA